MCLKWRLGDVWQKLHQDEAINLQDRIPDVARNCKWEGEYVIGSTSPFFDDVW